MITVVRALRSNLLDVERALVEARRRHVRDLRTMRRSRSSRERLEALPWAVHVHRLQAGGAAVTGRWYRACCVVVCDSWGVGDAPDAAALRRRGLRHARRTRRRAVGGLHAPNLAALGLGPLTDDRGRRRRGRRRGRRHGRATERSAGKDTTTGHWEMMGIRLDEPFPLYPDGFPPEVIEPFERAIGRAVLGNGPASGTEIIAELGEEHLRTRRARSSTRAATRCSRSPHTSPWSPLDAALRVVPRRAAAPHGPAQRRPRDRATVRRRARSVRPQPGTP